MLLSLILFIVFFLIDFVNSVDCIGSICFDNYCGGGVDWLYLLGCEEGDGF